MGIVGTVWYHQLSFIDSSYLLIRHIITASFAETSLSQIMHSFTAALFAVPFFLLILPTFAHPSPAARRKWSSASYTNSSTQDRAKAVKRAFETAWDGYYAYAFPNDDLLPVSNTFGNSR